MSSDRSHLSPLAIVPAPEERETAKPSHPHHVVQFYDSPEFLIDSVARFLGAGLGSGEPALAIAIPEHIKGICERLDSISIDVARALKSGQLVLLDAEQTLDQLVVGDSVDIKRVSRVIGSVIEPLTAPPRVRARAYGEMVNLLWQRGKRQLALDLEEQWTNLCRLHPLSLLCAYTFGNFYKQSDAEQFQAVCRAHTHVLPTESYTAIVSEEARLREVGLLQQRALSLESEIEHRKRLESALQVSLERERVARTEAEAATQAKDEFLAMLGHELRNPLAPIVTALQLGRLRGIDGREIDVIERQVGHLVQLVDDLLDVSRITSGKVMLRRERFEIAEVVAQAIETASPLLERRRHALSIDVPRNGCRVNGDRARLAQVISNLLTNAGKYSDIGTSIEIWARSVGGRVRLRVRDHGIGIEPHMLERIFDSFVQQVQDKDRSQGGLGLGLAIVRSLVALHGGKVSARSKGPGSGSEFEVDLPAALEAIESAAAGSPSPAERVDRRSARRILVVDDNEDAALLLSDALNELGHSVRVAHDGPSALRVAAEFMPELGFLDIGLPAMDGYDLAVLLKQQPWADELQLVAITGYGQARDRERSLAVGFSDHLVKPVDLATVLRIARRS